MMSEFTPGPWTISGVYIDSWSVIAPDGFKIATIEEAPILEAYQELTGHRHWSEAPGETFIERPIAEVEANTRLIAAAPELLEALMRLRYVVQTRDGDLLGAVSQATDAINKARGES